MLYILYRGNHPDLDYRQGQRPILHLQADLEPVMEWADANRVRWAFTDRNAGTRYTDFFAARSELEKVEWEAVNAQDFRDAIVREAKQAEFLLYGFFPMSLIHTIGVYDNRIADRVAAILAGSPYSPDIRVEPTWYY